MAHFLPYALCYSKPSETSPSFPQKPVLRQRETVVRFIQEIDSTMTVNNACCGCILQKQECIHSWRRPTVHVCEENTARTLSHKQLCLHYACAVAEKNNNNFSELSSSLFAFCFSNTVNKSFSVLPLSSFAPLLRHSQTYSHTDVHSRWHGISEITTTEMWLMLFTKNMLAEQNRSERERDTPPPPPHPKGKLCSVVWEYLGICGKGHWGMWSHCHKWTRDLTLFVVFGCMSCYFEISVNCLPVLLLWMWNGVSFFTFSGTG